MRPLHQLGLRDWFAVIAASALGTACAAGGSVLTTGGFGDDASAVVTGDATTDSSNAGQADGSGSIDQQVTMEDSAVDGAGDDAADASGGDAPEGGDEGGGFDGGCPTGFNACDGGCAPALSIGNCGSCGMLCTTPTPLCALTGGAYTCLSSCPSPQLPCNGACIDTTKDPANCGSCGQACTTSVANASPSCSGSTCGFKCNAGFSACGGGCVDFQTDNANCGGCGGSHACTGGKTCAAGSCGNHCTSAGDCPSGQACNTTAMACTASCSASQPCNGGCCVAGTCVSGSCPTSVATYVCGAGGCNAAGGTCTGSAQGCACTSDSQCKSAKCVKTTGQNDVACGSNCTGAGAADGFGCQLAANGIPAGCTFGFGYTPSNFVAATRTPPANATTDCNATYSSSTGTFTTGACAGQAPTIVHNVAQTGGGPNVDILLFSSLTIAGGSTLTLTGSNAVILAVYGNATLSGNIVADGAAGGVATGSSPAASGPGGAWQCSGSAGGTGASSHNSGGGGGGGSGAGGKGGNDGSGNAGGTAGAARANASLVPLYGGCPGGAGGNYGATAGKSPTYGGGGGGAVQISAAGSLTVTGTISAQGGGGGVGLYLVGNNHYAGGAGGGSGGAILLEGNTVSAPGTSTLVGGGAGGACGVTPTITAGGAAGTSGTPAGTDGTEGPTGNPSNSGGGGGGGGYGYVKTNQGAAAGYICPTALSPAPVCNAGHTACLCVADSDCSSGKCVNVSGQCTGTCTGSGTADVTGCQATTSTANIACSSGNCSNVTSSTGTCAAGGVACWCTADTQCAGGKCANWDGCAAGACTGSGTGDGFNCVP